jgi:hypothetical protein
MTKPMHQEAPDPVLLRGLIGGLEYKAGWSFSLEDINRGQGSKGLTLIIKISGPDSYHPERNISVKHFMIVPAAGYDGRSWQRWLFDQILLVERHEACEFFQIGYQRPYAPSHGPGNDPYLIRETGSELDAATSFRGDVDPAFQERLDAIASRAGLHQRMEGRSAGSPAQYCLQCGAPPGVPHDAAQHPEINGG